MGGILVLLYPELERGRENELFPETLEPWWQFVKWWPGSPFPAFCSNLFFTTWLIEEGNGKERLTTIIVTTGKAFSKRHQHNFVISTHDEGWAQPVSQEDSRSLLFLVGILWVQLCGELQPFNQVKDSFLSLENKLKRGKSGGIKSKSLLGTKAVSLARIENIIWLIGCWEPKSG